MPTRRNYTTLAQPQRRNVIDGREESRECQEESRECVESVSRVCRECVESVPSSVHSLMKSCRKTRDSFAFWAFNAHRMPRCSSSADAHRVPMLFECRCFSSAAMHIECQCFSSADAHRVPMLFECRDALRVPMHIECRSSSSADAHSARYLAPRALNDRSTTAIQILSWLGTH